MTMVILRYDKASLCFLASLVLWIRLSACQTAELVAQPCFGVQSLAHKTQLLVMYSGSAYSIKTGRRGIPLTKEKATSKVNACAYALALPSHSLYRFLTIYVKRANLNVTRGHGRMQLLFLGDSSPGTYLSKLDLNEDSEEWRNIYINTEFWPKNTTLVYMLLSHTFQTEDIANLQLEISLTPTFLCFLPQLQNRSTYTNLRNPLELGWSNLHEIFHPGWLTCTDPWVVFGSGENHESRYVAYCIDHRLSCDGKTNCPSNEHSKNQDILPGNPAGSSDERSRGLVCYIPSVNWILIAIALFTVLNIGLLFAVSYIGFLRRYSPMRFLRLQSSCIRYGCCCLPTTLRAQLVGNYPVYRRDSVSSNDWDLPLSPPTYESVQSADSSNIGSEKRRVRWKRRNIEDFAESGHNLPPSYVDANEELGVMPERILLKMRSLRHPSPRFRTEGRHSSPRIKPFPGRIHRQQLPTPHQMRQDLRFVMRQAASRTRALVQLGFRVVRLRPSNQIHSAPTEQMPPSQPLHRESALTPDNNENPDSTNPAQLLPNYFEFISGEYPRHPQVINLDYQGLQIHRQTSFNASTRLSRQQRRRHSQRRRMTRRASRQ